MFHHLEPVALVAPRQFAIHLAARRAEIAFDLERIVRDRLLLRISFVEQLAALFGGNQVQRVFAHRAGQFVVDVTLIHFLFDVIGRRSSTRRCTWRLRACASILRDLS